MNLLPHFPIEVLDHIKIVIPPRLIDRLESSKRFVGTPFLEKIFSDLQASADIVVSDILDVSSLVIAKLTLVLPVPIGKPVGGPIAPMVIESIVIPLDQGCST